MLTVLLKKDYQSKDETYPIIIRATHAGKVITYNTKFKVKDNQFKKGLVIKHIDADLFNSFISDKLHNAKKYLADCALKNIPPNLSIIFEEKQSTNFNNYILKRADHYDNNKQPTTGIRLKRLEFELTECFGTIYMSDITIDKLREYEAYLRKTNGPNTIAKKFKTLKQLFQAALDEGLHTGANPFKKYKIPTKPVKKEKLTQDEIKAIEDLKLKGQPNDARNLFLFSYYAKGVRFENCLKLKRDQIRNGRIYFTTNKGNKHISVLITSKLKNILDQYPGDGFIFPFSQNKGSSNSMVNRWLKLVAGLAGIEKELTFHISRHSISYHLKQSGVGINSIKDILGHSDTKTTEAYLKTLDDEQLDEEMKKVYGE